MRRNLPTRLIAREIVRSPGGQVRFPTRGHAVLFSRADPPPPPWPREEAGSGGDPAVSVAQVLGRLAWYNQRLRTLIEQSERASVSSPPVMIHEQADACHQVITRWFPSGDPQAGRKKTTSEMRRGHTYPRVSMVAIRARQLIDRLLKHDLSLLTDYSPGRTLSTEYFRR